MSAFFPVGMAKYNSTTTAEYTTWKGTGIAKYPVGKTAAHMRPLTNNDPTNNSRHAFGLPRPLKWQFRRGGSYATWNPDRNVRSTTGQALMQQMQDAPGLVTVLGFADTGSQYRGVDVTLNYKPIMSATETPQTQCTTALNCCNKAKNALKRVRGASTLLKSNYYTTLQQYRQARCETFEQNSFNFYFPGENGGNELATPGSPAALENMYYGGCYPSSCLNSTTGRECHTVAYNPKNYQYATQGAVDSSARTFKLAVAAAETAKYQARQISANLLKPKQIPLNCGSCIVSTTI